MCLVNAGLYSFLWLAVNSSHSMNISMGWIPKWINQEILMILQWLCRLKELHVVVSLLRVRRALSHTILHRLNSLLALNGWSSSLKIWIVSWAIKEVRGGRSLLFSSSQCSFSPSLMLLNFLRWMSIEFMLCSIFLSL